MTFEPFEVPILEHINVLGGNITNIQRLMTGSLGTNITLKAAFYSGTKILRTQNIHKFSESVILKKKKNHATSYKCC
jgi:hypothetical protein